MTLLPEVRAQMLAAAERQAAGETGWSAARHLASRWRRSRRAVLVALLVVLAAAAVAVAATQVFQRGSSVGPEVAPNPRAIFGIARPGGVQLMGLRVADPRGGPPWGLRVVRTTRGLSCVELGRVEFGTIGVLGQDGAFGNDGRFHFFSVNRFDPLGCVLTDAHGHAFENVVAGELPASAWMGGGGEGAGCYPPGSNLGPPPASVPRCPAADLRDIAYGLLGPDAVSVVERTASGGTLTVPTSGPDGAYLVVLAHHLRACMRPAWAGDSPNWPCPGNWSGFTDGPNLTSSSVMPIAVVAVTYRDGHICRTPSFASLSSGCPPVGFAAPGTPSYAHAQLAAPIRVSVVRARRFCVPPSGVPSARIAPCDRSVPRGYSVAPRGTAALLVVVSFRTRVAIVNGRSEYATLIVFPRRRGCTAGAEGDQTLTDLTRGQRVSSQFLLGPNCPGIIHGTITYQRNTATGGSILPGRPFGAGGTLVGRFAVRAP